jgi:Tfp pilus assembly protein PilP
MKSLIKMAVAALSLTSLVLVAGCPASENKETAPAPAEVKAEAKPEAKPVASPDTVAPAAAADKAAANPPPVEGVTAKPEKPESPAVPAAAPAAK